MIREANDDDFQVIKQSLTHWRDKSPALHVKLCSIGVALGNVLRAIDEGRAWMADGYFILVDVGSPWFSSQRMLIEEIIIRVRPTTLPVSYAIDALDLIAEKLGCTAIAAGDTQIGYMTPHYHAAGYTTLGTQLMKEVSLGRSTKMDGGTGPD